MDLILALLLASTPCAERARAVVREVETVPIAARAARIETSFRSDPALRCGLEIDWARPPPPAKTLTLEVSPKLAAELGALHDRVQQIAAALAERGALSEAHRRLLETWLLSRATRAP